MSDYLELFGEEWAEEAESSTTTTGTESPEETYSNAQSEGLAAADLDGEG